MITYRPLNVPRDWWWVASHINCVQMADTRGVVAERNGEIVGIVVVDSWGYNTVQAHFAAIDRLAWKGMHKEVFQWVFGETGREIILGMVPADNVKALRISRHFGMDEVFRIKDGHKVGVDMIILEMRKQNCKYFETGENHGKEISSRSA